MRLVPALFAFLSFLPCARIGAQQSTDDQNNTGKKPRLTIPAKCAQAASATTNIPEGISKEQADAILDELRRIRNLIEKQQTSLEHIASHLSDGSSPPERLQMKVETGWNSIGRTDAPITIVEFIDYECPFCKRFHIEAFEELRKNYIETGKVHWVARDLPLKIHSHALKAAQAVRCAGDQDKYWELYNALLSSDTAPNEDFIRKLAEHLSIDMKAFQGCLGSRKYIADVQRDANEAAALQINSTPSFVLARTSQDKLDGVLLVGTQSYAEFDSAIQQMLKADNNNPNSTK